MLRKKPPFEQPCSCQTNNFWGGLVLGALVGAGVYYYLTSKKGGETLDNLQDLLGDLKQKGEEFNKKVRQVQSKLDQKAKPSANFFTRHGKPLV
ncbi:hypothetical protein COT66_01850 [Candidatus Shapirobacteria bacterium CG09_land_8_20_14_0_10_49_15]|uniref:YtxH domain-containing protein n=1 Tax=Candidatus Shapirobacteria bacterium CG09_land_8_20_14_0_10_49_15 TaxID=1974482 RepID=A0A2M6XAS6_9BACT|nr:MAG: hypothetical protein COT66_01850 [Candidatus Shapirobacteria bacterium CG09_land_8_20_14_0_10_49_15]